MASRAYASVSASTACWCAGRARSASTISIEADYDRYTAEGSLADGPVATSHRATMDQHIARSHHARGATVSLLRGLSALERARTRTFGRSEKKVTEAAAGGPARTALSGRSRPGSRPA